MKKTILIFLIFCFCGTLSAQSWVAQSSPITGSLSAIKFLDAEQYTSPTNSPIFAIEFVNSTIGWLGGSTVPQVNKTTNSGTFWFNQPSLFWSTGYDTVDCIQFLNSQTGWVSTYRGVFKTTNGGTNWNALLQIGVTYGHNVSSIFFLNEMTGWAVKSDQLLKTTNGGLNWTSIHSYPNFYPFLPEIQVISEQKIWLQICCYLYRTTDGGSSWVQCNTIPSAEGRKIKFFPSDVGYCVASTYAGKVYKTTNGAQQWQEINLPSYYINNLYFLNEQTGWLIGNNGTILKTTTGGITFANSNSSFIPDNFSLSQNYPNPFNPSTTINYELPITNYVSIKIYNVLGNEIETLVNENQDAGSYSVDFNASSLPSGIYFYKLVTEKFSETKKMILVK